MGNGASQASRRPTHVGARYRLWRPLLAALLLTLSAGGRAGRAAADAIPLPCFSILSPPPIGVPGQPIRVRLQWDLADPAEPDPTPTTDLTAAVFQWGPMTRSDTGVIWEGDLIPLCSGTLAGQITCAANLPLLPADLPRAAGFPVPSRYLANLYSPCRARRIAPSVALPPIAVAPWPQMPPDMPPFAGLLGVWSATLTAQRRAVSMHEPLAIDLRLQGHGSATLFQAPTLSHPDLDVPRPTVERGATKDVIHVRWTVIPTRVPLEPLRLDFSTLEQSRYSAHHLRLALNVLPDPPPQAGAPVPSPVLLRFHAMPAAPTRDGGGALAAGFGAALAALAGLILAGAARHRDDQHGPDELRRAALRRLRQTPITAADELPRVHGDLQVWLRLPGNATATEIEAALRPTHPQLADELRSLESCRFSAAAATANPERLQALLRRLSCLVALAVLGHHAPAALPPEEALPQIAAEAFRQRDFGQACNALNLLRQTGRESPELLLNLGNAYWFTGRRIEALALYERAVRQSPRRQDIRLGLAWLHASLPALAPAQAMPWTLPIRDRLRPDEWALLAGLLIGLGCLSGGLLRWWRRPIRYALTVSAAAACVCLWFAAAQWTGTYRVGATARLTQAVALRAAPAAAAEALTPVLPAGTLVTPASQQPDWLLVRTPTAEGWVPETGCILVW